MITVFETPISDLLVIEPKVFGDDRGYFLETYNLLDFKKKGLDYRFVQDNQSKSRRGVLRGLHYQVKHPQAKLVRVLEGEVFDVAVDLRRGSKTYGKWFGTLLSETNKRMLMIPRGFAHGFLVVSEEATFAYKCDEFYYPDDEGGLPYNDEDIGINWPDVGDIFLSPKDRKHVPLKESGVFFDL